MGGGERCNSFPPPHSFGAIFALIHLKKDEKVDKNWQKWSIPPPLEGETKNPHPPRGGCIYVPEIPCSHSQSKFGPAYYTPFCDVFGAKQTHFMIASIALLQKTTGTQMMEGEANSH